MYKFTIRKNRIGIYANGIYANAILPNGEFIHGMNVIVVSEKNLILVISDTSSWLNYNLTLQVKILVAPKFTSCAKIIIAKACE